METQEERAYQINSNDFYDKSFEFLTVYNGCDGKCLNIVGQIYHHKKYRIRTSILNNSSAVWQYIHKIEKDGYIEVSIYDFLTFTTPSHVSYGYFDLEANDEEKEFFKNLSVCLRSIS